MHVKSLSFTLVVLVLAASFAGIATIKYSSVASGATATGTPTGTETPHFKQLSAAFIKYFEKRTSSGVRNPTTVQASADFIPPPNEVAQPTGQAARSALVSYAPSSFDLSTQGKVTAVRDQGSCGACWAFAAMASLESFLLPGETRDFSENNMKNLHGFDLAPCAGGNQLMATAYLARWSGPVDETADPYNASSTSSPSNLPVQKHVQDVYFLPDRAGPTDNDNIKSALQTHGAVSTTLFISGGHPPQYNNATNAYYITEQKDGSGSRIGPTHSVAIVGWNDSFSKTNFVAGNQPPGDGAFIVKNEWGSKWGDQGYFYVSYYDAYIGENLAVYAAQPTSNYNHIYQYDPLGDTLAFGEGSNSEWGANVFTATSNEQLSAVGFYTDGANTQYDAYVYLNPVLGPIGVSSYVARAQGTETFAGYHTIPLNSSVPVAQGQKFSVVMKFTTPNDNTPLPVETPITGYSSPTANAGESFYRADGSITWKDMTSYDANTNICIKAFSSDAGASKTTTQLTIGTAGSTTVGQPFAVKGALKANSSTLSDQNVTLGRSSDGTSWSSVGTNGTNASGGYQFALTESSKGAFHYRSSFSGDGSYTNATSAVLNVSVGRQPTQLSLMAKNANSAAGQSITLSGVLQTSGTTARLVSQPVYLLMSKDDSHWSLASSTNASTDGSGVYAFNGARDAGTYYFRTYYDGSARYKEAFSPTVKVTIGASATREPTKLSLSVSNANPTAGQSITLSGALKTSATTPAPIASAKVYLLMSKDGVNWQLASSATASTNSNGVYAFTGALDKGTYYFRTYYDGTAQYKEAFGPVSTVVVR
ncbi:MAG: lectin like domain-containing protein [Halobacteriota archaeon]